MTRSDLLSVADLGREGIVEVLHLADSFAEVSERPMPKVPALRGRTVATVFFESSTRTRLSFEAAAKRLSADTMTFTPATSSITKGESMRDTVETLDAMGVDAMVVRHASAGAPAQVARWVRASVVNAGDGQHEHPTQALLDCFTLREAIAAREGRAPADDLSGLRIAVVGDVRHSRVARSGVLAYRALGARVVLVAPPTLLPPDTSGWGVETAVDLDEVLGSVDVVYLLRLQAERIRECLLPSLHEYAARFGLTRDRARRLAPEVLVMHPGPMVRGLEIDAEVASSARSLVTRQVHNGVAVRMAVLFRLLAGGRAGVAGAPGEGHGAPGAGAGDVAEAGR
ncbi:MAG TPA: aspartate carbamoyltransferase catalytic subunit [Acidimicrobiales bacterium]|nr:aspartate carbamoyltransferase catalytic subunit [Acidimicrobiales bacterium]